MMTLDQRIEKDLEALYNNGLKDLIAKFNQCKIQEAEDLSIALFGKPNELSSHGLPGYFTGNRSARTVMVMLNPGQDVATHNNPQITDVLLKKLKITTGTLDEYLKGNELFGTYDKESKENEEKYEEEVEKVARGKKEVEKKYIYPDSFDLKQAAFLKRWPDCGVKIDEKFPPSDDESNQIVNKEHTNYELAKQTAEIVLRNKLQLELVPYASRKFDGIKNYEPLFPFVETLFDEIFSEKYKGEEPRYVIFCADVFDKLFKSYNRNKEYPGWIEYDKQFYRNVSEDVFDKTQAYCTPIRIHFKGKERHRIERPSLKAVIAHTFPNQALSKAYNRMVEYGKFCWETYCDSKI